MKFIPKLHKTSKIICGFLIIELILTEGLFAEQSLFYKELNLVSGYSDIEGWIGESQSLKNSVGFEYYRKFSGEYGDYLTCDLQTRLSYDNLEDSNGVWGVEIHNAWLDYKLMQPVKMKVGHFDCPFGLEPVLDTHGTLLQTLAENNIGFKQDWGAEFKGYVSNLDYEVAFQLGSGMSIIQEDENFLASARIGLSQEKNPQVGFSLLYGDVLETKGMRTIPSNKLLSSDAVTKKRVGLDGQYLFGPYLFKGEIAYGENDKKDVLGYLGEIDYTLPAHQNLELELQFKSWINDLGIDGSDDTTLTLGTSYKLSQSITLRAALSHDFNLMDKKEEDKFIVQFYFFGR